MRKLAGAALAMVAVLSCGKKAPPAPAAPAPAAVVASPAVPAAPAAVAVVTASSGEVALRRKDGERAQAKVGDQLAPADALETGPSGEADLSVEGVRLRVHDASRLMLQAVGERRMRARMKGSVESDVQDQGALEVEDEETGAVAKSRGGHFFVTADGRGVMTVAAVSGTVNLSAHGKTVAVRQGEISHAGAATPSDPTAALRRVLLAVEWPDERETSRAAVPISGRVAPGSRVYVQGARVPVGGDGGFRAEVPLGRGPQKIAVVAVDPLGRRKQVESTVRRDDSLPAVTVKKKLWQWH